jgi:hypothetical protein
MRPLATNACGLKLLMHVLTYFKVLDVAQVLLLRHRIRNNETADAPQLLWI